MHNLRFTIFAGRFFAGLFILLLLLTGVESKAQNTVSPYSVFGPGEIQNRGFSSSQGMAGAGIALKSGNYLNNLNPASYTGIDSLRIISEFGVAAKTYTLSSQKELKNGFTGNLSHIGLGFRYTSWLAGSFGVVPFSTINYSIVKTNYMEGVDQQYTSDYVGSGGISQFYFGNALRIGKHLSFGVNFSYMFGSLIQEENIYASGYVPNMQVKRYDYMRSLYFDYGLQYSFKKNKKEYSLGVTFAPEQDLRSKHVVVVYDNSFEQVGGDEYNTDYLTVPNILGVGLGVVNPGKYKFALDYSFQEWSKVSYPTQGSDFVDLHRVVAGLELRPWPYSAVNAAYKNWIYRFGVNYQRSYLNLGGSTINDKSFTVGLGIPLPGKISEVNISVTGGINGTTSRNLVQEKYLLFNLGFNLNEIAFMRRVID
ncbi:hypothetical protein [Maribellus sp. YY47]|uniref:hypothetical protein n=1 Tax=Maribellus sp. YY47 TaxID=2929486 RepID=UPI0020018485|nr:hypothetical protein [Maribellus sp. YY47]MCK3684605.1 hypothetical protein [Maribellus sp. YY47]